MNDDVDEYIHEKMIELLELSYEADEDISWDLLNISQDVRYKLYESGHDRSTIRKFESFVEGSTLHDFRRKVVTFL